MSKAKHTKRAFTLVEMLVVITIIGIIGAMAVGFYSSGRKQAKLEMGVDNLISIFKEQEQKAKSGQLTTFKSNQSEEKKKMLGCYGVYLQATSGDAGTVILPVQYVLTPYYPVKDNRVDNCETALKETVSTSAFEDLEIRKILLDDLEQKDLQVFYKPPFAKRDFMQGLNFIDSAQIKKIKVVIGIKNTQDQRCFEFNNTTGVFSVLLPDQC